MHNDLMLLTLQQFFCNFLKDFIYLYLGRGKGNKNEKERNINVWSPLVHPLLGTWPGPFGSQATLNPLSYTSQGYNSFNLKVVQTYRTLQTSHTRVLQLQFNKC